MTQIATTSADTAGHDNEGGMKKLSFFQGYALARTVRASGSAPARIEYAVPAGRWEPNIRYADLRHEPSQARHSIPASLDRAGAGIVRVMIDVFAADPILPLPENVKGEWIVTARDLWTEKKPLQFVTHNGRTLGGSMIGPDVHRAIIVTGGFREAQDIVTRVRQPGEARHCHGSRVRDAVRPYEFGLGVRVITTAFES